MEYQNSYQTITGRKNNLFFTVILFLFVFACGKIFSQEDSLKWKLNSVSISTGETPLTKGNTLSGVLSKNKSTIILDYNDALGELLYFYSLKKWISIGFSGGEFNNVPWWGPIATLSFFNDHVKTLFWFGWSAGNTEDKETKLESSFCFSYHQASINYKGFEAYYANQIYRKYSMEHIFGIKKTFTVNKNISLFGGAG